MSALEIRPMESTDLDGASTASAAAFGVELTTDAEWVGWRERIGYGFETDPAGSFVAARDGQVVGIAQALKRERLWILSTLAVQPGTQSRGAGKALMDAALDYRAGTDAGLIVSSNDPRALRVYGLAGFSLRPTFEAGGALALDRLPPPDPRITESDGADVGELADISRELRGAPHTRELEFTMRRGFRLLRLEDRGFALAQEGRGIWMVAARDEETAAALLWSGLRLVGTTERSFIRWITGGQDWAIDVVLKAGLRLTPAGALGVSGRPGPLRPFVPSPPFA